jgi:hypothetical protein
MAAYADLKDGVLDVLNDAIVEDPEGVLDDIAWLEDQISGGDPVETRSFVAVRDGARDGGWSAQRPYIGAIRDVLSITSNGSQFEFGTTPQQHDNDWATVFAKNNEIDYKEITFAQTQVHETQSQLRAARAAAANKPKVSETSEQVTLLDNDASDANPREESDVAMWERLNAVAKQQRALIRLRALALIAHGPVFEIPKQPTAVRAEEIVVTPQSRSRVGRAADMLVRAAAMITF